MSDYPTDAILDLEFAYTSWRDSCRDTITGGHVDADGLLHFDVRACRRPYRHEGQCAAGYGTHRIRWTPITERATT